MGNERILGKSGERKESHEKREKERKEERDIHMRCNRRIYRRTRTAVCAPPLSPGILAVNKSVIYDPRACISIPQRPDYQVACSTGGRCLLWTVASDTLHSHQRRMSFFRGCFLRVSFFLRDAAAAAAASAFMRIPAGFRGISDSERAGGFDAVGYILRRVEPHPRRVTGFCVNNAN